MSQRSKFLATNRNGHTLVAERIFATWERAAAFAGRDGAVWIPAGRGWTKQGVTQPAEGSL